MVSVTSAAGIELALRPVVERDRKRRTEARGFVCQLWSTLVGHTTSVRPRTAHSACSVLPSPMSSASTRAEPGVAQEAQPVDAGALIAAELGAQIRRQGSRRQAAKVAQQRLERGKTRRLRLLELVAQRRELKNRCSRHAAFGIARREQITDALPVAREPVERQRRPAAPDERHQRKAILPRAQDRFGTRRSRGAGIRALVTKLHRQRIAVENDVRHQRELPYQWANAKVTDPRLKIAQARSETIGLETVEVHAAAGDQVQLVAQPIDQAPLRGGSRSKTSPSRWISFPASTRARGGSPYTSSGSTLSV